MSDDELIQLLTKRWYPKHIKVMYCWQCWCPECTTNIVSTYRSDPDNIRYSLSASVHAEITKLDKGETTWL